MILVLLKDIVSVLMKNVLSYSKARRFIWGGLCLFFIQPSIIVRIWTIVRMDENVLFIGDMKSTGNI